MNENGFTIIEVIVVIAIIGIISAIFIPSYRKAQNNKELLLGMEQVLGDIRTAQSYSYNTLKFGGVFPEGGYGVHFDISATGDPKKYIIFADVVADQTYDSATEKFQEIELPRSVEITTIRVFEADGSFSSVTSASTVFKSPYGKVFIYSGGVYFVKLEIEIKNDDGDTRTIKIEDSGLIN